MCNAWKHPDNCDCGFGPPYPWEIELIESIDWTKEAFSDRRAFLRILKEMNFDPATAKEWHREYSSALSSSNSVRSFRSKFNRFVHKFSYIVEESGLQKIKIPLFKLHSPACKGSKVTYSESVYNDIEAGWKVKLFGTGMGNTKIIKVTSGHDFKSCEGQCKQVFLPVELLVERVAAYRSGVLVGRFLRAELANVEDIDRKRGIESRPEEHCVREVGGEDVRPEEFLLSGDQSGESATFRNSWVSNVGRDIELSLKAFGITIGPLANVRRERRLDLEFELPCGYDYYLRFSSGGLHWRMEPKLPLQPVS